MYFCKPLHVGSWAVSWSPVGWEHTQAPNPALCSTLLLSISLGTHNVRDHNKLMRETPKPNSSCCGVGQAGMLDLWQ